MSVHDLILKTAIITITFLLGAAISITAYLRWPSDQLPEVRISNEANAFWESKFNQLEGRADSNRASIDRNVDAIKGLAGSVKNLNKSVKRLERSQAKISNQLGIPLEPNENGER